MAAHSVFARVTPADKLRLVEAHQRRGEVVAVTGDGVNDTPALRRANVGIAMGRSGNGGCPRSAEIVLTDDDFATIVAAIEEGRRIGDNVRKFVAFLLSANLGEVVLFAIAVLAGIGVPMSVVQVLTVNLVTDGLPAIALARDPASRGTMDRGPRPPGRLFEQGAGAGARGSGRGDWSGSHCRVHGGRSARPRGGADDDVRDGCARRALRSCSRSLDLERSVARPAQPSLLVSVALSTAFVVSSIYVVPLHDLFATVSLGATELGIVVALALAPAVAVELVKSARRRWGS